LGYHLPYYGKAEIEVFWSIPKSLSLGDNVIRPKETQVLIIRSGGRVSPI
jgi:hypothetical protein